MLLVKDAVYLDLLKSWLAPQALNLHRNHKGTHTYHPQDWSRMHRRAGTSISAFSSKPPPCIRAYIWVCLDILRRILRCCWYVGHGFAKER